MVSLAGAYQAAGQLQKALPLFEEALEKLKTRLGPDHPRTLLTMNNLAAAYWEAKQFDRSAQLIEQLLAKQKAKLGLDHPDTLETMAILAANYGDAGRLPEAVALMEDALSRARKLPGPLPAQLTWLPEKMAALYDRARHFAKSEPLYQAFVEQARQQFGQDHEKTAAALEALGANLLHQQKYASAEPVLRECLGIRTKQAPDAWATFHAQSLLGGTLVGQKKYTEAAPLLVAGYEGMKQREAQIQAQGKIRLIEALERLVQLYDAWDRPDAAAQWRKALEALQSTQKPPSKLKQP
jgi:tetratricopeptide (TPR) repeat protein